MAVLTGRTPSSTTEPRPAPSMLRRPVVTDLGGLGLLVLVLAFLWGRGRNIWFWLDEGIAVGIASHPLADIPALLRQDGSPPFFYLLLHGWMSLFGSSEGATHALSLLFAVAVIPAAFWAGRSLFDRRTGWMCAGVAAVSPFLAFYANETRMYSLVVLLTVLTLATFAHAFVFGRRRYLAPFAVSLVLLAYTHNWGLLLGIGTAVALVPCYLQSDDRRRLVKDAALAFGGVALLYLPWLPTLLYQQSQELQPWAPRRATLVTIRTDVINLLGGQEALVAMALGAGVGFATVLKRPWTRSVVVIGAITVMTAVVLGAGWLSSVWAYRYLAVAAAALFLLVGVGLAQAGRVGLAALGTLVILLAPIGVKVPPYQKSNMRAVAEQVSSRLRPGDLVFSPDVQLTPLLANHLPDGLRYFTTAGAVPDEDIVDWRDSMERLERGDPAATLTPVLDGLRPGQRVLLACPPTDPTRQRSTDGLAAGPSAQRGASTGDGDAETEADPDADAEAEAEAEDTAAIGGPSPVSSPRAEGGSLFHELIRARCDQTLNLVVNDPTLQLDGTFIAPAGVYQTPVDGYLLTKR